MLGFLQLVCFFTVLTGPSDLVFPKAEIYMKHSISSYFDFITVIRTDEKYLYLVRNRSWRIRAHVPLLAFCMIAPDTAMLYKYK